jgi:hypothetical protein
MCIDNKPITGPIFINYSIFSVDELEYQKRLDKWRAKGDYFGYLPASL